MMWMMGCKDGGEVETIQDQFSGRRLRPLTPRSANAGSTITGPCLARIHGNDLLALNHHLAMAGQGKRDLLNTQQVVVTSRWNPTPEQLQTLEELYRRGTRTPSAEQIQQITAQLRRYGKIEGKNVFYWFQNHKARERQKRRRQIDEQQQQKLQSQNTNPAENREAGGSNKPVGEVEQTRSWASPTNSSTAAEQTVSPQGEGPSRADSKADDGWLHFDEEEENAELLQLRRRNDTWQTMHLSYSSRALAVADMVTKNSSTIPKAPGKLEPEKTHKDFITIFSDSLRGDGEAAETLELFPLRSGGARPHGEEEEEEEEESGGALNGSSEVANPYQFFEFLPLKN